LHQINKMKKRFYKFIFFKLMGWKIEGSVDSEIKKCVFMVMPHTSWHDFYLGVFTRGILGIDINFVAKKELFDSVFAFYFKYMGGEPLDRTGGLNKVEAIAKIFERKEIFKLGISPEGTRKKVSELKSGFYFIALKANVPIIPVAFNYGQKSVQFGKPFSPTGNFESDLKILKNHFLGVKGKFPKKGFDIKN
jgi:1-acyl-sn-glycerol-3-phosphate acyltransferase